MGMSKTGAGVRQARTAAAGRHLGAAMLAVLLVMTVAVTGFAAYRPVIIGTNGIVISNHPLATFAGVETLQKGGNAVDAAIATAAALGVVEPYLSGPGGDGFLMFYEAATGQIYFLNMTGRAPAALTLEHFTEQGASRSRGPFASLIPGAVAGWDMARERFGRLSPAEILAPAIRLAEEGYPATEMAAREHRNAQGYFLDWDEAGAQAWWGGALNPPNAGDIIRNPKIARTYRTMAEEGFRAFYDGWIAEEIVRFNNKHGGVFSLDDFRNLEVYWEEPLQSTYRGYHIFTPRPNSSGGLAVPQILNIIEGFDIKSLGVNTPEYIHIMIEAIKLAAADRAEWAGDPLFMDVEIPYDILLSKEYAAERRAQIDLNRAAADVKAGIEQPGTSHITVVDKDGNLASMTMTLGSAWGSGMVAGETGLVLNNGVNWFEVDPTSPAVVEGGKRTRWNMAPAILLRPDGQPYMAIGASGGTGIWQTIPQVITKIIDFGMNPQDAVESPRFTYSLSGVRISVETRLSDTFEALTALGHQVSPLGDWATSAGSVHVIVVNPETGAKFGGADPRREGYAIGW